jgi:hypothetical protein
MDLNTAINIDISDPEAVKGVQQWLRAQGLYTGPIDGQWGPATTNAIKSLRDEAAARQAQTIEAQKQSQALEQQRLQTEATKAANDPVNRLTRMGTEVAPYAAGLTLGGLKSYLSGRSAVRSDAAIAEAANRLANAQGVTPQAARDELNRLTTRRIRGKAGGFLPAALAFGAGAVTRDVIAPQFSDKQTRDIINAVGTGENAAGLGMTVGAVSNLMRADPIDPVTRARIMSAGEPVTKTPARKATTTATVTSQPISHAERAKSAYFAATGKRAPTKEKALEWLEANSRKLTKQQRAAVVKELGEGSARNLPRTLNILKTTGKYVIPALVAAEVADSTYSQAKARGMSDADVQRKTIMEATAAGGGTAGGMYLGGKVLNRLRPVAKRLLGRAVAPAMVGYEGYQELTQENPENRPFSRRLKAALQPSSLSDPRMAGVNVARSELGLDDLLQDFVHYMKGR